MSFPNLIDLKQIRKDKPRAKPGANCFDICILHIKPFVLNILQSRSRPKSQFLKTLRKNGTGGGIYCSAGMMSSTSTIARLVPCFAGRNFHCISESIRNFAWANPCGKTSFSRSNRPARFTNP